MKEDPEGAEADDAMKTKEESEDVVEAFEGITDGKACYNVGSSLSTSCKVNWENTGKISKEVQVKIPQLKMGEKLSLHMKEQFRCCQCLKRFKNKRNLNVHIQSVHFKAKPHQCGQCSKKFSVKSSLDGHIRVVHNKEKSHICLQPGCTEMFGMKLDLKKHMMKIHSFEKPYSCIEKNCAEKFVELRGLKDHLRSAHGAARLVCGIQNCAETFTFESSLLKHKKNHKLTSEIFFV